VIHEEKKCRRLSPCALQSKLSTFVIVQGTYQAGNLPQHPLCRSHVVLAPEQTILERSGQGPPTVTMIDVTAGGLSGPFLRQIRQYLCATSPMTFRKRDDLGCQPPNEGLQRIVPIWNPSPRIRPRRSPQPVGNQLIGLIPQVDDQSARQLKLTSALQLPRHTHPS
jgi:hypothetical protein